MFEAKIRKWGNSFGIIISKIEMEDKGLHENQKVLIEVKKKENPLTEMFGAGKFSKPTIEILKENRKNTSKYLK